MNKNKIRIIDPKVQSMHDPLFCVVEEQLEEYIEEHLSEISSRSFVCHSDFVFRKIADEGILVPTGRTAQVFNGMINLNATSTFLWNLFSTPTTVNDAVSRAEELYEGESLQRDVIQFVVTFYRMGLLIPEDLTSMD